jgi:hypothetical protein
VEHMVGLVSEPAIGTMFMGVLSNGAHAGFKEMMLGLKRTKVHDEEAQIS